MVEALAGSSLVIATVANSGSSGRGVVAATEDSPQGIVDTAAGSLLLADADVFLAHQSETAQIAADRFGPERVVEMLHMPVRDPARVAGYAHGVLGVSEDQLREVRELRQCAPYLWHSTPRRPLGEGGPYVVWVGRFDPCKGALEAMEAASRAGAHLKLIGTATNEMEEEHLRSLLPRLGDSVEWLGHLDGEKRDGVVAGAAALLMPAQWREPFGLVSIEAAMLGTPVLAFPGGALREIVATGLGVLCSNVEDLAAAIRRVMGGEFERSRVQDIAQRHFSPEAQMKAFEHALLQAAGRA